jgi:putative intracellular protease/amidase
MPSSKCSQCGCVYPGSVCPRCAVENVRHASRRRATEIGASVRQAGGDAAGTDADDTSDRLEPNTLLGHFLIIRCLGKGGMSWVYEALDTKLQRKVAIKVPRAAILRDAEACEWFTQEGQAIARMKDPRIVRVYHSEVFEGLPCHVMEFVKGETLTQRIRREQRLAPETAVAIARDIALGLLEIHVHGRLHGDIKPANVMIHRHQITIIDFGLSRVLASAGHDPRTMAGTPVYMAPERVFGETSGVSEDVYSLGCTLLEMLLGKPFEANAECSVQETLEAGLDGVPKTLLEVVKSLVADDPIDRPASAKEAAQLLDAWLARKKRARRTVGLAIVAIPLLLAALGYAWVRYPPGEVAVLAADGSLRARCVSLAQAVAAAQEGGVIELRADGPFCSDRALVAQKPLTIRAASGCLPQLELASSGKQHGALTCLAPLTLEGLVVRCADEQLASDSSLVCCEGTSLRILNCRFELPATAQAPTCLTAVGDARVEIQNSVFVGRSGTAVRWKPTGRADLSLANCLALGITAVEYQEASPTAGEPRNLRMKHCSLIGDHVLRVVREPPSPSGGASGPAVLVELHNNVFRSRIGLVQFTGWDKDCDAARTMAALVDWRDLGNAAASDLDRTVCWTPGEGPSRMFRTDALAAWSPYWERAIEDVTAVFVLGGNVEGLLADGLHRLAVQDLLQRAATAGKTLCGVGDGPAVLAAGGFLKERRATVQARYAAQVEKGGAEVVSDELVQDGHILTAESNFHMRELVSLLGERPWVLGLIAEDNFWFDDFRAAKFEVEMAGGTFLTVSTSVSAARPNQAGGGETIVPDLLLPLLRYEAGQLPASSGATWLSADLSSIDPYTAPVERFALEGNASTGVGEHHVPGVDPRSLGPRPQSPRRSADALHGSKPK